MIAGPFKLKSHLQRSTLSCGRSLVATEMDPRGGSAGNNWSLFVGGEQRDVTEFLDNDSLLLLQNLKDLRREIGGASCWLGSMSGDSSFVLADQIRLLLQSMRTRLHSWPTSSCASRGLSTR